MRDGLGGALRANHIPRSQSAISAFYPTTTRQQPGYNPTRTRLLIAIEREGVPTVCPLPLTH
jgi:hypothetical protein